MAITTGLETLIPALCGRQGDSAGRGLGAGAQDCRASDYVAGVVSC